MKVQFSQRCLSMMLVLVMLFTMSPVQVLAEEHDHAVETTDAPIVTAEEVIAASAVAELVVSASSSASYMYVGDAPVAVTAKISGGMAPYEVTLQAVKNGEVVSTKSVTTESASAVLSFAPTSYGDYDLVVLVHDALHTQVLTSVALAVAEHAAETETQWAASVSGASVSSNWSSSLVSVARTQVGYAESEKDFIIKSGAKQGYTRYGGWFGTPYGSWNTTFVLFAAEYAKIPNDRLLSGTTYRSWVNGFKAKEAYMPADGSYSVKAGDIAFLNNSRVAIVESFNGANVTVIEGDVNGAVVRKQYKLSDVVGIGNTSLMMGLHTGSATPVPTATRVPGPGGVVLPEVTVRPTAKPTATPMPEFEDMIAVATATPAPGVTTAPKNDDVLGMMGDQLNETVEVMAAEATAAPMQRSENFYRMQEKMQALKVKYLGEGDKTPVEIKTYVDGLELADLFYITVEVDELEEYAQSIGLSEAEALAVAEVEDDFSLFTSYADQRWTELTVARTSVDVLDGQVTITDSANSISASGNTVTATAKGSLFSKKTNNLTITNNSGSKATLAFDYAASGTTAFTIGGATAETSGKHSVMLEAGGNLSISFTSNSGFTGNTATLTLSSFSLTVAKESSNITFEFDATYGSVTVAGAAVSNGDIKEIAATGAELIATPVNGARFLGWVNVADGTRISTDATYTIQPADDMTIQAIFVGVGSVPHFGVGAKTQKSESTGFLGMQKLYYHEVGVVKVFDNLNDAITAANSTHNTIVLLNDGTLTEGTYTIPAGVTLLIPFDDKNTLLTTESKAVDAETWQSPTAYRTLTMANGAHLVINGAMSLSARHTWAAGSKLNGGSPTGPVSFVRMEQNSTITVNNSATLYAFGYITGEGSVTANSGATVFEYFQIMDFRGGTQSTDMQNGVFPLSQYYVQNIEVPLTLHAGATEKSYTTVYMSSADFGSSVAFIASKDAMFNLTSGYVVKDYDETTDRLVVNAYGNMTISPINMSVGTSSINSKNYELGVNSNITVTAHSGNITMGQDLALLPGSKMIIEEGAKCVVSKGVNVYVYDADQWGTYCGPGNKAFIPVTYAPGRAYTRTEADLVDAMVVVNGTVDASEGYLYTTAGGANVISTGNGVVTLQPGTQTVTHQLIQNTGYVEISITPAKLKNADGNYTLPQNAEGVGTYTYTGGKWVCAEDKHVPGDDAVTVDPTCTEAGSTKYNCKVCGVGVDKVLDPIGHKVPEGACTAKYICDTCKEEVIDTEGTHRNVVTDAAVAPTCTETGLTAGSHCDACGAVLVPQVVQNALGHEIQPGDAVAPGCTTEGNAVYEYCSREGCGYNTKVTIPATGHNYVDVGDPEVPDCGEVRYQQQKCTNCGEPYSKEIPPTGNHEITVPDANTFKGVKLNDAGEVVLLICIEAGSYVEVCEQCGTRIDRTLSAKDGHTKLVEIPAVPATCTAPGSTAGEYCEDCTYRVVPEVDPQKLHDMGEWEIITPSTCTVQGEQKRKCKNCDRVESDEIARTPHDYQEYTIPATCTTNGEKGSKCSVCNAQNPDVTVETILARHQEYQTEITQEATCSTEGLERQTCTACGLDQTVSKGLNPAKHENVVTDAYKAPTCTEDGLTEGSHCAACDVVIIAQDPEAAPGHKFVEAGEDQHPCVDYPCKRTGCAATSGTTNEHNIVEIPAVAPNCTVAGSTAGKKCGVCGTVTEAPESVPALGHKNPAWTEDNKFTCASYTCECGIYVEATSDHNTYGREATCTEPAYCWFCKQAVGEALGHDFGGIETKPCGTYYCSRCEKDVTINPEELHSAGPACKDYQCEVCGQTVAATADHKYDEATCTKLATCAVCGDTTGELEPHTKPAEYACTASYTCVECNAEVTDPTGKHEYSDATCDKLGVCVCGAQNTEDGYRAHKLATPAAETCATQTCQYEDCGVEIVGELKHDWKAATCVAPMTCSFCGTTEGDVDAEAHNYVETAREPATCVKEGSVTTVCSYCGDEVMVSLPIVSTAHPQDQIEIEKEGIDATCYQAGHTRGDFCNACSTYINGHVIDQVTEHDWFIAFFGATCEEPGYMVNRCRYYDGVNCTATEEPTSTDTALGHKYQRVAPNEEGTGSIPATCTTDGKDLYTCERCDNSYNEVVPATGHKEPEGWLCAVQFYCITCGTLIENAQGKHNILDKNGEEMQSTCMTPVVCKDCKAVVNAVVPHKFVNDNETQHACKDYECLYGCGVTSGTTAGHDMPEGSFACVGYTCDVCGDEVAGTGVHDYTFKPATCQNLATCACGAETGELADHVWAAEPYTTVPAGCTTNGYATYKCTTVGCNEEDVRVLTAVGHQYNETEEERKECGSYPCLTCGELIKQGDADHTNDEGWTCSDYTCSVCNQEVKGSGIHQWNDATCVANATCKDCRFEQEGTKLDTHKWDEQNPDMTKEPTCTEKGQNTYKCTVEGCTATAVRTDIPAKGHKIPEGYACSAKYICATCNTEVTDENGKHAYSEATCTVLATCVCGATTGELKAHTFEEEWTCGTRVCTVCKNSIEGDNQHDMADATCMVKSTCKDCGHVEGDFADHVYTVFEETVKPDCSNDGYTVYSCVYGCGKTENRDPVPASHPENMLVEKERIAPTCVAVGYEAGTYCTKCNTYTEGGAVIAIDNTAHVAGTEYVVTIKMTCQNDGENTYYCIHHADAVAKTETVPCDPENHTLAHLDYVQATCETPGHHAGSECTVEGCGATFDATIIPALGHEYDPAYDDAKVTYNEETKEWVLKDCDEGTTVTYTCNRESCTPETPNHSYVVTIEAKAHVEETIPAVAATCYETGWTAGTKCATCGEILVKPESTDMIGHSWGAPIVVEPDCVNKANGYTYYVCTVEACQAKSDKSESVSWEKGHDLVSVETAPTCQADGFTTTTCKNGCDYNEVVIDEGSKLLHNYKGGIKVTDPTCTEDGYTTYTCQNEGCGYTETREEVPAPGHKYETEGSKVVVVGCFTQGYTIYTCDVCGDQKNDDYTAAVGDHTWVTVLEAKAPTCTEAGWTKGQECKYCDEKIPSQPIPKNGHSEKTIPAVAATCYATGLTEGTKCATCGEILVKPEPTEKIKHNWGDPIVVEPDCVTKANGYTYSVCTVEACKAKSEHSDDVAWTEGHALKTTYTEPTCITNGYNTKICEKNCGYEPVVVYDDPETTLGHDYSGAGTQVTAPTCEEKGYTTYTCQNEGCGYSYKDNYIDPLQHNYQASSWDTDKVSYDEENQKWVLKDCDVPADVTYVCANDASHVEVRTIEAKAHVEETIPAVAATCYETGWTAGTKCATCGEILVKPELTEKIKHTYESEGSVVVIQKWNCTQAEVTRKICDVCNTTTTTITKVPTGKHTVQKTKEAKAATCTEDGWTAEWKCTACDYVQQASTVLTKLGHDYTGAAATCTTPQICNRTGCDEVLEPAKGHTFQDGLDAAVDCHDRECAACGTVKATGEHQFSEAEQGKPCIDRTCLKCSEYYGAVKATAEHDSVGETTKESSCTEEGLTTFTCKVCGTVTGTEPIKKKAHECEPIETVNPTCTQKGYTIYKCKNCDHTYNADEKPMLEHEWQAGETTVAPDCEKTGIRVDNCKNCTATKDVVLPAKGHQSESMPEIAATCMKPGRTGGEWCAVCQKVLKAATTVAPLGHAYTTWEEKPATCKEAGYTAGRDCSRCDETDIPKQEISKLPHTEVTDVAVAPTCTATGKTEGKHCSVCGEVTVTQTTVAALGHTEETLAAKDPTCTGTGLTEGKKCSVCGEVTVAQNTVAALGHKEETLAAKAPTCTETGRTEGKKCSVCGVMTVPQQSVDAKGHNEEILPGYAAECEKPGLTEGKKCKVCGMVTVPQTEITALKHVEEILPGYAAECEKPGLTEGKKCKVCGKVIVAQTDIPALEHVVVSLPEVPATCTTPGKTAGSKCSVCNTVIVPQNSIPAKQHDWDEGVEDPVRTCTQDGKMTYTCKNDPTHTRTQTLAKTGHTITTVPAQKETCEAIGWAAYEYCKNCDYTTYVAIPATGHAYEGAVTTAPTCTEAGVMTYTCQNDKSHVYTEAIEATGHTLTEVEAKAPACEAFGWEAYEYCTVCTYTTYVEIPATGHDYVGAVTKEPSCTETGVMTYTCQNDASHTYNTELPLAHKTEVVEYVAPTCTEDGKRVVACTVDGCDFKETEILPKKGHVEEVIARIEPTCEKDGWTEGKRCTVCEATLVAPQKIAAGHKWSGFPCTEDGVYCTVCNERFGDKVGHQWINATCTVPKTCAYCGLTEGDALGHDPEIDSDIAATCTKAGSKGGKSCVRCGEQLEAPEIIPALGHKMEVVEAKKPSFNSVGWNEHHACARCGFKADDYKEIPKYDEPVIDTYEEFIQYLPILEELANQYIRIDPSKDPVNLIIKYIRTGVERYNSGSWNIMAGYEDPGFAKFVQEQEDQLNLEIDNVEDMIKVTGLKNLVEFTLPEGQKTDMGHTFGTMDITYHNYGSRNHADVGGWTGDLVDLLSTTDHDMHQDEINAVINGDIEKNFEALVTYIHDYLLCKSPAHSDVFSQTDFIGDLDAFYILETLDAANYTSGDMTALFQSYFTADLSDRFRADYLLRNRLDGVMTRSAIRTAVYDAYTSNSVISTLEQTREFKNIEDLFTMRQAVCYAFADHLCYLAGYWTDVTDNPYVQDFETTFSKLAPGINMEIHKAYAADGQQMVYYIGTAELGNPYVKVMANYDERDVSNGWQMERVLEQAQNATRFHSNPETDFYIENFAPVVAINGAGFNMSTGEPSGLLVMHGHEYQGINSSGFFGVTKSGRAVIGSMDDYNNNYKGKIEEGIAGFGTMLVVNGEIATNIPTSNYYSERASRTAVGITKTGDVVYLVVDGRQPPWSCGGSMIEIAQIMQMAGCVTAINLDGGGSTTFVARRPGEDELSVVNRPSDGSPRSVSASLMFVSTAPSSKVFDKAVIEAPYNLMTNGASMQLTAKGVSPNGNEVDLPEGLVWTVSDPKLASITEDGVVTAKAALGEFHVILLKDGVNVGQKQLNIVIPDQIYFTKDHQNCNYGESVDFAINPEVKDVDLRARYESKEVAFILSDVTFTMTPEDGGTMDRFVFTATTDQNVRSVVVTAALTADPTVIDELTIMLYDKNETGFDFDNATLGDRTLALKREVSNAICAPGSSIYNIVKYGEPMVTSYTLALDMTKIPIPERLMPLIYMLPNSDADDASAWMFLMQLAERISVLTTVKARVKIDPNFDVNYDELTLINEYFSYDKEMTTFNEETHTLEITLKWIDQTAAIEPEEADPLCVVSGLKLTPKENANWDADGRINVVVSGEIEYDVYLRANALYSFCQDPNNREEFGLKPFDNNGERGGGFSAVYATFTDTYSLINKLKNGWLIEDGGFRYYINGEYLTGIQLVEGFYYQFDDNGINIGKKAYTGKYQEGGYHYYIANGEKVINKWVMLEDGWYHFSKDGGKGYNGEHAVGSAYLVYEFENGRLLHGEWYNDGVGWKYYYGPGCYNNGWQIIDGESYFFKNYYRKTGILPVQESHDLRTYWYEFDSEGRLIGRVADGLYWYDGELYLVLDALAESKGLVEYEGEYYFAKRNGTGAVMTNGTLWINASEMNGRPFPTGTYLFDEQGRMIRRTGVVNENGTLYYYYEGVRKGNAGLIEFEGNYYHVGSSAICTVNGIGWVGAGNIAGLPSGNYRFDENGHIVLTTEVVYNEVDKAYQYFVNGKRTAGAGLVWSHGYYYFFESGSSAAATNKEIYVGKNNLGLDAGTYRFGPDGKAILETKLVEETDGLYYYKNGKLDLGAGLIKYEGDYYYIDANGKALISKMQEITANGTIDHFGPDTYEFGADGKMIIREGIYNGYWYANGTKTAAGLVEYNGDYYYAAAGGKIVSDTKYEITAVNGLPVAAGIYRFDVDGKINLTTELVKEDGVYYYYDEGRLAKNAGLIKLGQDYYYITADGSAVADRKADVTITNGLPVAAGTYRFDAEGKAIMTTDLVPENGKLTYYKNGRLAVGANLIEFKGDYYWIDMTGHALASTSIQVRDGNLLPRGIYRIGADCKINLNTEVEDANGKQTYYLSGVLTANAGLVRYNDHYYFIGENALAVQNTLVNVTKTNGLPIATGTYRFGADGKAIMTTRLEENQENGTLTYFKDGKLTANAGLVQIEDAYYFIGENALAAKNQLIDVTQINGLSVAAGTYRFGEDGKAIMTTRLEEDAQTKKLTYFKDGKLTKDAGLILLGDAYYFIMADGTAAQDTEIEITDTNGLDLTAGTYRFGPDGKAILTTELVEEDGKLNYYVQGKLAKDAGLILYKDGGYYYIQPDGSAAQDELVEVTEEKAHGRLEAGIYRFDADGKAILTTRLEENAQTKQLTYFKDGKLAENAGLIKYEGAYYYIVEDGVAVTNAKVDVPENKLGLPSGTYRFGEDGKAILETMLVEERDGLYYYKNGKLTKAAGLIKYDGAYYYIDENGKAVTDTMKEITAAEIIDHFGPDTYQFGADGKMIIREGIYNGYWYVNGTKNAAGLVKVGEDYYYAAAGGELVIDARYEITKTNGLPIAEGTYRFDEEGKLILSTMLVDEDGNLTYYKDGKLTANAGLIEYDEAYYYIGENGIAVTNEKVDVPENDLGVAPGIHCFGNDGKMFERLAGDADDNGVVNIYDALNIIKYISNQTENINYLNADVNEDNKVDIYDALNIMKNGAGWAVELK